MLTHAWVNGIAVAVVAGSLAAAWYATRKRRDTAAKSAKGARKTAVRAERQVAEPERDPRPWRIYLNEAEIERREAIKKAAAPPATETRPAPVRSADGG
jgi:hypothetical protein